MFLKRPFLKITLIIILIKLISVVTTSAQEQLIGKWRNKKSLENSLNYIIVTFYNQQLFIQPVVTCIPADCVWTRKKMTLIGKNKNAAGVIYENSDWQKKISINLLENSELECVIETVFTNGNQQKTEYLILHKADK
ncbi:MAG: hypothetical protein ACOVQE_08475 [Chitinophagaceae bacterium]